MKYVCLCVWVYACIPNVEHLKDLCAYFSGGPNAPRDKILQFSLIDSNVLQTISKIVK